MTKYDSFLLRVWRNVGQDGPQWAGRLEHLQQGECIQVSSLEALVERLQARAGPLDPRHDDSFATPAEINEARLTDGTADGAGNGVWGDSSMHEHKVQAGPLTMARWHNRFVDLRCENGATTEVVGCTRQRLALVGRLSVLALRKARREQVVRCSYWLAQRWLRTRLASVRRTGAKKRLPARSLPRSGYDLAAPACRRVVVMGDSLGVGQGDRVPGLELVGWAARLELALRSHYSDVSLTNLAQSGLTTELIARTQLDRALALQPDLVLLIAGGNDLMATGWDAAAFSRSYRALVERLLAGGATVLTTTWHNVPLAVSMPPAMARRFSRRLDEASAIVRRLSAELGAQCLDFWQMPDLLDAGCYSCDGIHPNARGYLRVAEVIADSLGCHAGMSLPHGALRSRKEHQYLAQRCDPSFFNLRRIGLSRPMSRPSHTEAQ